MTLLRTSELVPAERAARQGQIREGLRYVRAQPHLLWTIVLVCILGTFGYNWAIILSSILCKVSHAGAGTFALLNMVFAAGTIWVYLSARRQKRGLAELFVIAFTFGVLMITLGAANWPWVFVAILAASGVIPQSASTR